MVLSNDKVWPLVEPLAAQVAGTELLTKSLHSLQQWSSYYHEMTNIDSSIGVTRRAKHGATANQTK